MGQQPIIKSKEIMMYTLASSLPPKVFWLQQMPVLAVSFAIAESFYKFGSFALECLAFLATWFVLDAVASLVRKLLKQTR
jgi:hypothetical protein